MSGDDKGYLNKGFENDNNFNNASDSASAFKQDPTTVAKPPHTKIQLNEKKSNFDGESPTKQESPNQERAQWDSQWEFLFSCVSMSVGLGNVWRFPFVAYENGGGAFLIPYLLVLVFIGRPIYFLELCLGQFTSFSQVKAWKCAPLFKGVGYAQFIATFSVLTYYVSVMAICTFYFVMSFKSTLPWSVCNPDWGEEYCNGTERIGNYSLAELYFEKEVIKEPDNIDDGIGNPDWKLTLCLLFSWAFIFLVLIRGVKSSGKFAYFTAVYPYLVLITFLIQGLTLEGAIDGVLYFVTPEWSKLYDPTVWYAAVEQAFFSLNTGFGSIMMFASFNPFKHNIYRDAAVVSVMDTLTSLLAGFTVFSILGHLAYVNGVEVENVVKSGTGLAFVSYPETIATLPASQFFSVIFFIMLFTLGVGSAAADSGAIITLFCDRYQNIPRWMITGALCALGFSLSIPYVTPGGQFIVSLVDFFGAGFVIFLTSTVEVMGIAWGYGVFNFIDDVEFMLDRKLGFYWKFCWGILMPVGLTFVLIYSLIANGGPTHGGVGFPAAALVAGGLISFVALICVPLGAYNSIQRIEASSFYERFKGALKPRPDWGPRDPKIREEWINHKQSALS